MPVYTRDEVALRNHQKVRLRVTVPVEPAGLWPWNLETRAGSYHTVWVDQESLQYRASHLGDAEFWLSVEVAQGAIRCPRLVAETDGRLVLLFGVQTGENTFDTMEMVSTDGGATWTEPAVVIAGGKWPTIAAGIDGTLIRAAWVDGAIVATEQPPGAALPSAPFTLADDAGALAWEDDTFHLQQEWGPMARWWLHGHLAGETDTSDWFSHDGARTFTRFV